MSLFALEHSRNAYRADFALYACAVVGLAVFLAAEAPHGHRLTMAALISAGLLCWSVLEYLLHRFVLHGLQPFKGWHEAHHNRPSALICAPTFFSAMLIITLVFVPAFWLGDLWRACALTLGVVAGYLGYAITHHATHHWRADSVWLRQRKRWHALHHHSTGDQRCFGVTSALWDHVFGSAAVAAVLPR